MNKHILLFWKVRDNMANISYDPKIEDINDIKKLLKAREKLELTRVIAKKHLRSESALALKHAIYYLLMYIKNQHASPPSKTLNGETILEFVLSKTENYNGSLNSFQNISQCINSVYNEYHNTANGKTGSDFNFNRLERWLNEYSKNKISSTKKKAISLASNTVSKISKERQEKQKLVQEVKSITGEYLGSIYIFYSKFAQYKQYLSDPDTVTRNFNKLNQFLIKNFRYGIANLDRNKIKNLRVSSLNTNSLGEFKRYLVDLKNDYDQCISASKQLENMNESTIKTIAEIGENYFGALLTFGNNWEKLNTDIREFKNLCLSKLKGNSLTQFNKQFNGGNYSIYRNAHPEFFASYENTKNLSMYLQFKNMFAESSKRPNDTQLAVRAMKTYSDIYKALSNNNKILFFERPKLFTLNTIEKMRTFTNKNDIPVQKKYSETKLFINGTFDSVINTLKTLKEKLVPLPQIAV